MGMTFSYLGKRTRSAREKLRRPADAPAGSLVKRQKKKRLLLSNQIFGAREPRNLSRDACRAGKSEHQQSSLLACQQ
jgi:hypothetical protein